MQRVDRRLCIVLMVVGFLSATLSGGCGGGSSTPPITVIVSSVSPQSVDQGQSANLTAIVTNDTSNKGVAWSATCSASDCGSFSSQTATSAMYSAPKSVTANLSVTIVATSAADPSKSASTIISIVQPPSVTTGSLPGATGGVVYSVTLNESGGIAPFSWSLTSGSLPDGIGLDNDTISGSPTRAGTFKFTMQVADSGSPPLTASANLSITVTVLPLSISTLSLPDAIVDTSYKQSVKATGGIPPYAWSIAGGGLPSWSSLTPSTGAISGIPGSTGKSDFTIQVADSAPEGSATTTQALSITTVSGESQNNSELNGHYAFLFDGFDDASGSRVAIAGSFTADGKGNIMAGLEDENGPSGPALSQAFTGTYNVSPDHRGGLTLKTATGSRTFALVLNTISTGVAQNGRLAEFDDTTGTSGQRGSGILRSQDTTAFSQGKLKGPYAFGFAGSDQSGNRTVLVGSFQADGAGTIPNGIADQNVAGTTGNPSLSGSYTAPSAANGHATMSLSPSGLPTLNLSVYVVSGSELLAVSTDSFSSSGLSSGTILAQASTSFDNSALDGPAVYYETAGGLAEVGLLALDGSGNASATYDKQTGRTLVQDQTFIATYAIQASGRVAFNNWYGDSTVPLHVLYLVTKNTGFLLDTSAQADFGMLEAQTSPPAGGFSTVSFSGTFSAGTVAPSATDNANGVGLATLDGGGGFSESTDLSTSSGLFVDQTTTGTYAVDASGRGTVTSLNVTTAGLSVSLLALALAAAFLVGRRNPHRTKRSGIAMCCMAIWVATTPASCPPRHVTQLVFYAISPQKAVMIQLDNYSAPAISVVEK